MEYWVIDIIAYFLLIPEVNDQAQMKTIILNTTFLDKMSFSFCKSGVTIFFSPILSCGMRLTSDDTRIDFALIVT